MSLVKEKSVVQPNVSLNIFVHSAFFYINLYKLDPGLGIFLTHLMATLTKADDTHFRRDIYQCYHCLYGVHLAVSFSSFNNMQSLYLSFIYLCTFNFLGWIWYDWRTSLHTQWPRSKSFRALIWAHSRFGLQKARTTFVIKSWFERCHWHCLWLIWGATCRQCFSWKQ